MCVGVWDDGGDGRSKEERGGDAAAGRSLGK